MKLHCFHFHKYSPSIFFHLNSFIFYHFLVFSLLHLLHFHFSQHELFTALLIFYIHAVSTIFSVFSWLVLSHVLVVLLRLVLSALGSLVWWVLVWFGDISLPVSGQKFTGWVLDSGRGAGGHETRQPKLSKTTSKWDNDRQCMRLSKKENIEMNRCNGA